MLLYLIAGVQLKFIRGVVFVLMTLYGVWLCCRWWIVSALVLVGYLAIRCYRKGAVKDKQKVRLGAVLLCVGLFVGIGAGASGGLDMYHMVTGRVLHAFDSDAHRFSHFVWLDSPVMSYDGTSRLVDAKYNSRYSRSVMIPLISNCGTYDTDKHEARGDICTGNKAVFLFREHVDLPVVSWFHSYNRETDCRLEGNLVYADDGRVAPVSTGLSFVNVLYGMNCTFESSWFVDELTLDERMAFAESDTWVKIEDENRDVARIVVFQESDYER